MNGPGRPVRLLLALAALAALPAPLPAAEPDRYLPADTEAVVFVNLRQVLNAPAVKKNALDHLKAAFQKDAETRGMLAAFGLDPFKDLTTLTLATSGSFQSPRAVLIAHGQFDVAKIHATLDQFAQAHPDALKIHKDGTARVYEGKSKDGGEPTFAALVDRETLVVSQVKDYVVGAVARGTDGNAATLKKGLRELLGKVDDRQSAWLASLVNDDVNRTLAGAKETASVAGKLLSFTGHVAVTDAIQVDLHIHVADAKAAGDVRRLLDGFKGLLLFAVQQNEEFGPLLTEVVDGLKVTAGTTSVTVSARVGADVIEKGLMKLKK